MPNTLLLSTPCCSDEHAYSLPSVAVIELTQPLITRLKELHAALLALKADSICDYDKYACWSNINLPGSLEGADLAALKDEIDTYEADVECTRLYVSNVDFWFTGFSGTVEIGTQNFPLSVLDELPPYFGWK